MAEYPTQLAALEALLDDDAEAAAELLVKLDIADLRCLAHVAQDLQTLCQDAWTCRIAWGLNSP